MLYDSKPIIWMTFKVSNLNQIPFGLETEYIITKATSMFAIVPWVNPRGINILPKWILFAIVGRYGKNKSVRIEM